MMIFLRAICLFLIFSGSFVAASDDLTPNFTVMIPMRDGVELPTDVYLPPKAEVGSCPCVLMRSPAGRRAPPWLGYAALAQLGYVVALQDTRSALDHEGKTLPYLSDGWGVHQDGYDAVEWLAKSAFTNGKVGTIGFSAVGITQLLMAPSAPPSLKCQYIGVAAGSLYHHGIFVGGQILKNQVEGWLGLYAKDPGMAGFVLNQPFYNDFWESLDTLRVADRVQVPAVHYGGWYDTFVQGTIDAFVSRQERGGPGAKGKQKLLIGPWTHYWPVSSRLGDFDIPADGENPPVDVSLNRWLDHYLKEEDNGVDKTPSVMYYVMGPFDGSPSSGNCWRTADSWPVPAVETAFYLTADQKLVESKPNLQGKVFPYIYDPHNPVPTIGGRNLFLEAGPKDVQKIEKRDDVIVFTTEPFQDDIEITGRVTAKLYFSSDQRDTDVVLRLTDVYPDGRSILIADSIYRTGYTDCLNCGEEKPSLDQVLEVDLDLWSTSLVFAKGHSMRISVTSSNYPRFEKNPNVGIIGSHSGNFAIAKNNVHVGGENLSHITIPVVRRGQKWVAEKENP